MATASDRLPPAEIAGDRQPAPVDTERRAMPGDPADRGQAILQRHREFMLGAPSGNQGDDGNFR